ncbi:MAG: hypothetical protein QXO67_03995 [Candidatus Bathyarchaeia archaeon]
MTLINFQTLHEILSDPEWRRRLQTAVTYEEARKVILDYYREKAAIKRLEEKPVMEIIIYCENCDQIFELVGETEPFCPIDPTHKIEVLG